MKCRTAERLMDTVMVSSLLILILLLMWSVTPGSCR